MKVFTKSISSNHLDVYTDVDCDNHIGKFIRDVDGYFYFDNEKSHGLWSSYSLRMIACKLEELNKPWDDQLSEYFKQQYE